MSRLTERYKEKVFCKADCSEMIDYAEDCECPHLQKMKEKLAHYEDLEEQGLLLKLPIAKGDAFWEINRGTIPPSCYERYAHSYQHCVYVLERLGKTCFLTKAEAEKALAEMSKDCTDCRNYWQNTDTGNECNGQDKPCHEFAEMEK